MCSNLSDLLEALRQLVKEHCFTYRSIVQNKAEKVCCVAVLYRDDYIKEVKQQLEDKNAIKSVSFKKTFFKI